VESREWKKERGRKEDSVLLKREREIFLAVAALA
jgi:hypothetical protein